MPLQRRVPFWLDLLDKEFMTTRYLLAYSGSRDLQEHKISRLEERNGTDHLLIFYILYVYYHYFREPFLPYCTLCIHVVGNQEIKTKVEKFE